MKQYLNLFDFTQSELQDWNFGWFNGRNDQPDSRVAILAGFPPLAPPHLLWVGDRYLEVDRGLVQGKQ
jgi:hypothetical protein